MKGFAIVAPVVFLLSAAPTFAQAAAQARPTPAAGQAAPRPAPAPASRAQAPTAQAAPPLAPPAPFPQGAKVGLVNLQQIAQLSADGKVATAKIQALIQKKQAEGAQKTKLLQDNQTK